MTDMRHADERPAIPGILDESRIVAILRHTAPERAVRTVEALVAGGVRAIEVTLNSAGAIDMLHAIQAALGDRVLLGAGTVLDQAGAQAALDAGARFMVSPHTDLALIRWLADQGVPVFPGAFTATEVLSAWRAGASVVKLFPSGPMGASYLKDLRGPLGHIPFMPTGGVTLDNAATYMAAGAWGLGLGSDLVSASAIDSGDYAEIARRATAFAQIARPRTPAAA